MKLNFVRGARWRVVPIFAVCLLFAAAVNVPRVHAQADNLITAIQDVAKKTIPAVAHVEVTETQKVANPLANDPFFQYFFGNQKAPRNYERIIRGLGSGILIDSEGHILTNNHVVHGATKIKVLLSDGRQYTGNSVKLIGTDPKTDLAVIQILSKESFPFVKLGDSDKVEIGQWVVAIGQPQGLDQTVTQGIISAKHRRGMSNPTSYEDFLQTDAAINPGNSGGPLLNLNGEVIGVNAAIVSRSGGFEGIGFAIPSNMAVHVAKQLIATGKVERAWMGISIQDLTPELASSFKLPSDRGALVAGVIKGSPADKAGIKQGDVAVQYDGKEVADAGAFRNMVGTATIGSTVTVTVMRNGAKQDIKVTLGSEKSEEQALRASVRERYGVMVRTLNRRETKRYGLQKNTGVIVSGITPKGAFAKAGMEMGDVILQINEQQINSVEEFEAVLGAVPPNTRIVLGVVDHRSGATASLLLMAP